MERCDSLCDDGCDLMTSVGTIGAGIAATVSKVIAKDGQILAKKVEFNKLFIFNQNFNLIRDPQKKGSEY